MNTPRTLRPNRPSLTAIEIQRILPHRYPLLLVDSVTVLEPGRRAVGTKTITAADARGGVVVPSTLLLEMMAQVGAVLVLADEGKDGAIPYFAAIERASFGPPVHPGDILTATIVSYRRRRSVGWGEGTMMADGTLICEARFTYAVDR